MEVTVKLQNIARSPQKIRPILYLIRGKNAKMALTSLQFVNKAGAVEIASLLKSAMAAAREREMEEDSLIVKITKCDQARTLKRHIFKARGRTARISKKNSHLLITLSDQIDVKAKPDKIQNKDNSKKENHNKDKK